LNNSPRASLEPSLVHHCKGRLSGLSEIQREGDNERMKKLKRIAKEVHRNKRQYYAFAM